MLTALLLLLLPGLFLQGEGAGAAEEAAGGEGLFAEDWIWSYRPQGSRVYQTGSLTKHGTAFLLAGGLRVEGRMQGVLSLIDRSGELLWENLYSEGDYFSQRFHAAAPTPDGGYLACGEVAEFDKRETKTLLVKFSGSGARLWHKKLGQTSYSSCRLINYGVSGIYLATLDRSDPEDPKESFVTIYKISDRGNVLWQRAWQRHRNAQPSGLSVFSQGLTVSGFETGGLAGGAGGINENYYFLAAFDPQGEPLWYKRYKSGYVSILYAAAQGSANSTLLVGETYPPGGSHANCFYANYNLQGGLTWEGIVENRFSGSCKAAVEVAGGYVLGGATFYEEVTKEGISKSEVWRLNLKDDGSLGRSRRLYLTSQTIELLDFTLDVEKRRERNVFFIYLKKPSDPHYLLVYRD